MIGRITLVLLASVLALVLLGGLLVGVGVLRIGPSGLEIVHADSDPAVVRRNTDESAVPQEDLWAKAYQERQEREKASAPADRPLTPPAPTIVPSPVANETARVAGTIRIRAGSVHGFQDGAGNAWEGESGFAGGASADRGAIDIANTRTPDIYRCEHYAMTEFRRPVPSGDYTVKLHFAETFDQISAPGQRVFHVDVQGTPLGDIDVFKEAGGRRRALVKSVRAHVSDGVLHVEFRKVGNENPEINGIEIVPEGR